MTDKQKWEEKLQKQGFDVHLDEQNIMMLKTSERSEAEKYKSAMEQYPYSWGIKKKGEANYDEEEILRDSGED